MMSNSGLVTLGKVIILAFSVLLIEGMTFIFWEYWASSRINYHERVDLEATIHSQKFETWLSPLTTPDQPLDWTNNRAHPEVAPDGFRGDSGPKNGVKVSVYGASFM